MQYPKKLNTVFNVLTLLLLLIGQSAQAELVGFYHFNDQTVNDSSGNNNHGSLSANAPTFTTDGFNGGGIDFNGDFSSFLTLPVNISPSSNNVITMGGWFNVNTLAGVTGLMSQDDCCYDRSLGIDTRGGGGLTWSAFTGGGVLGSTQVILNEWTFLAMRHDQATGDFTLDVNGVRYLQSNVSYSDGTSNVFIGRNATYDLPFDGQVDNVFIYDHALTDDELDVIRTQGESAFVSDVNFPLGLSFISLGFVFFSLCRKRA